MDCCRLGGFYSIICLTCQFYLATLSFTTCLSLASYSEAFFSEYHKILMQESDEYLAFGRGSKWARNCCSLFFLRSTRQILDIQEEKNSFPCGLSKRSLFSVKQNYFASLLLLICWCTFKSFGQYHIHTSKIWLSQQNNERCHAAVITITQEMSQFFSYRE